MRTIVSLSISNQPDQALVCLEQGQQLCTSALLPQICLSFCISVKVVRLINESYPAAFQKIQICLANEKLHQHQRSPLKRASLIELIFDHAQTLHKHSGNPCLIIS